MQQDYDHREYGRLMLRQLWAEFDLAESIEKERHYHCIERIADCFMVSLGAAELFVQWSDERALEMFHLGMTI